MFVKLKLLNSEKNTNFAEVILKREISLKTAYSVVVELSKFKNYKIKIFEPDGNFVFSLRKFKPT